jgi:hypothetical protein
VKSYRNGLFASYNKLAKVDTIFKNYDCTILTLYYALIRIVYKRKMTFIFSQKKVRQVGLLFLLVFGLSNSMHGQTIYTWNGAGVNGGTGDPDFNTAANWSPTEVPGPSSEARFNLNQNTNTTVTLSSNITIGKLTIVDNTANNNNKQHKLNIGNKTLIVNGDCSVTNRMGDLYSTAQGYYGIKLYSTY